MVENCSKNMLSTRIVLLDFVSANIIYSCVYVSMQSNSCGMVRRLCRCRAHFLNTVCHKLACWDDTGSKLLIEFTCHSRPNIVIPFAAAAPPVCVLCVQQHTWTAKQTEEVVTLYMLFPLRSGAYLLKRTALVHKSGFQCWVLGDRLFEKRCIFVYEKNIKYYLHFARNTPDTQAFGHSKDSSI